ncbi:hypothetical protein F4778DRAFT_414342 [Xylariomycetidae sp. FL2044]|nr:hypothetical protein F4778DRAFT_414342 [Xylariomycetidae sp. FL2044]
MKFVIETAIATWALGVAVAASPAPRTASSSSLLHQLHASGLDYDTWVDNMVAQGALYRQNTTNVDVQSRGDGWSLRNAACTYFLGGDESTFEKAKDAYCKTVRTVETHGLKVAEDYSTHTWCSVNGLCSLVFSTLFENFGTFKEYAVSDRCGEFFDALWGRCEKAGGTAQLYNGDGTHVGTVEAHFIANADAKCPEHGDDTICKTHDEL